MGGHTDLWHGGAAGHVVSFEHEGEAAVEQLARRLRSAEARLHQCVHLVEAGGEVERAGAHTQARSTLRDALAANARVLPPACALSAAPAPPLLDSSPSIQLLTPRTAEYPISALKCSRMAALPAVMLSRVRRQAFSTTRVSGVLAYGPRWSPIARMRGSRPACRNIAWLLSHRRCPDDRCTPAQVRSGTSQVAACALACSFRPDRRTRRVR